MSKATGFKKRENIGNIDEDDLRDRETEIWTDDKDNLQTIEFREKFGHLEVDIEDRYSGTAIRGPDVRKAWELFMFHVDNKGNKFLARILDDDAFWISFKEE